MTDCTRKTLFGRPACRFEARYDETPNECEIGGFEGSREAAKLLLENLTCKTYVRDVCTKCGRTIERQKP